MTFLCKACAAPNSITCLSLPVMARCERCGVLDGSDYGNVRVYLVDSSVRPPQFSAGAIPDTCLRLPDAACFMKGR